MREFYIKQKIYSFEKKQYFVSAISLILLCIISLFLNSMHLRSVANESTRFLSRMIKIGDFREVPRILQEARLSNFKKIYYKSKQPDKSFILPPKLEIFQENGIWHLLTTESITIPVIHSLSDESSDQIEFEYDRFRLIPYAFLFWLILNIVSIPQTRYLKSKLTKQFEEDLRKEEAKTKLESELSNWMQQCEEKDLVCRQIHHDLASPLGLLRVSTQKLGDQALSKPFALSLDRLTKISEDLQTQKYIWGSENPKLEPLKQTLDAILQEKLLLTSHLKIQYKQKSSKDALNKVPDIPVSQFHRVLSNILNNAIDAIQGDGVVRILARTSGCKLQLIIADSGKGIPKDIAPHIFEKQKSFDKPQGSGLGLYHAKICIESFGGQLTLMNTRYGAAFKIELPIARTS